MILGISELHKLVKENKLVENLCDRELETPEGAGFDLRLDKLYKLKGRTFLGIDERETVDIEEVASFNPEERRTFVIKPGEYYLTQTVESVNMPNNLIAFVKPRTTLFRSGVLLRAGEIDPGYSGILNFGIYNAGPCEFEIEMGARYAHIIFMEVKGETAAYRGQWQGGRVVSKGREKQI